MNTRRFLLSLAAAFVGSGALVLDDRTEPADPAETAAALAAAAQIPSLPWTDPTCRSFS